MIDQKDIVLSQQFFYMTKWINYALIILIFLNASFYYMMYLKYYTDLKRIEINQGIEEKIDFQDYVTTNAQII